MLDGLHALDAFSLELIGRLDDLYFDLGKGWILSRIWQHKLVLNGQETFFFQQLRLTSRVPRGLCVLKFRNQDSKYIYKKTYQVLSNLCYDILI